MQIAKLPLPKQSKDWPRGTRGPALPLSFLSVSQNFCNSLKYLSMMNFLVISIGPPGWWAMGMDWLMDEFILTKLMTTGRQTSKQQAHSRSLSFSCFHKSLIIGSFCLEYLSISFQRLCVELVALRLLNRRRPTGGGGGPAALVGLGVTRTGRVSAKRGESVCQTSVSSAPGSWPQLTWAPSQLFGDHSSSSSSLSYRLGQPLGGQLGQIWAVRQEPGSLHGPNHQNLPSKTLSLSVCLTTSSPHQISWPLGRPNSIIWEQLFCF